MAAKVHCSRVCVGWNLLFKSLCWLKPLVLKFVLAEISCSRGCRISPYFRVFKLLFRFHQLIIRLIVIKSIAGKKKKKKKKSENLIWFLFFSCSCSWSGSCSCSCSCSLIEIKAPLQRTSFKYQLGRLREHEQRSSRMY